MFKFAVLSLLVLGCSALPYGANYRYGQTSYGLNNGYSGYRAGGYGLSTGFSGYGLGGSYGAGLRTGYSGSYLTAAPIATTTQVVAAPALQTVGYSGYQSQGANVNLGLNLGLLNVRQGQQFEQVVPAAIQQIARTVEYRQIPNQEQPIQAQVVEIEPSDNPVHLHFKTRSSSLSTSQSHVAAQAGEVQTAAAQDEPQRLITEVQKPVIQEVKEVIHPYRQVTQEINPVVESLHTIVTKGEGYRQQQYAAPAIQSQSYSNVVAAPAISTVAVQPALQTVAVQQPLVQTVGVQTVPALSTASYSVNPSYSSSFRVGGVQSVGYTKPLTTGYSSYSSSSY